MRRSNVVSGIVLLSVFLVSVIPSLLAQKKVADEEYKVYSAILKEKYLNDERKTPVIIKTTSPNRLTLPGADDQIDFLSRLAPITEETLKNYNTLANVQRDLDNHFNLPAKIELVAENVINAMFREGGKASWEAFYKQYPDSNGFIKFSRVGFNADKKQALIFVSHKCGARCASGTYYLLVKEGVEWKIKKEHIIWIS